MKPQRLKKAKVNTSFRLEPELLERLKRVCERGSVTLADFVRDVLVEAVEADEGIENYKRMMANK